MVEPLADFEMQCAKARALLTGRCLAIYDQTIRRVSPDAVRQFQARHKERPSNYEPTTLEKYGDISWFIAHYSQRAVLFDLDQRRGLRILDIGSGGGTFAAIANALGHNTIGIDVEEPFYAELCAILGID